MRSYVGVPEVFKGRIQSAWKKFQELSGALIGKLSLLLEQKGEILYRYCVWSVQLYYSETWGLSVVDEARLRGLECRMIRMMCGTRLVDRVSSNNQRQSSYR